MPNPVDLAYDSKDGYVNAVCSETGGEEARDALKEGGMQQEEMRMYVSGSECLRVCVCVLCESES